jgi:UDP-2,3-diacylglucosamine pyrophosphatase LpxH
MARYLVFSDLHFGDPLCSLRREPVAKGLRQFLRGLAQVDELILAGDILDANISSLTLAIEGEQGTGAWLRKIGFRNWLAYLFQGSEFNAGKIVYIPGNHDYIIWNILATERNFVQPISQGQRPASLPLMQGTFPDAFISGVAPPGLRNRFWVVYPDYEFKSSGRKVLVTHGHYLDHQQTLFKDLQELITKEGSEAKAVRKFFIATAQYQAVANAVSYMKEMRGFVDLIHKVLGKILNKIDIIGKLRDQPINKRMVRAIEMYLTYFSKKQPDVFIFGHTHRAGHSSAHAFLRKSQERLLNRNIEIWNDGCFIENPEENRAGSFILLDDASGTQEAITLFEVDLKGGVQKKNI